MTTAERGSIGTRSEMITGAVMVLRAKSRRRGERVTMTLQDGTELAYRTTVGGSEIAAIRKAHPGDVVALQLAAPPGFNAGEAAEVKGWVVVEMLPDEPEDDPDHSDRNTQPSHEEPDV